MNKNHLNTVIQKHGGLLKACYAGNILAIKAHEGDEETGRDGAFAAKKKKNPCRGIACHNELPKYRRHVQLTGHDSRRSWPLRRDDEVIAAGGLAEPSFRNPSPVYPFMA